MEIGLYIADLLGERDEVSVPGLGTFIKLRIAGTYDRMSNSFRPPYYQFGFKNSISGFYPLREYLCDKKGLNISSAEYFIKKYASEILDQINEHENAEIKHLGVLSRKNGIISFEPLPELENSGIFYGLKPLVDTVNPVSTEMTYERKYEISEPEDSTDEEYEYPAKSSGFRFIIIIFIILLAGTLALYFTNDRVNKALNNLASGILNKKELPQPVKIDSALVADTVLKSADTLTTPADTNLKQTDTIARAEKETTKVTSTQASVGPSTDNEIIGYEIIGAAFARKSEAEVYIKQIAAKGIKAKIAENMPGKMLKISFGSFKDEESAQKELTRIQKEINKDAWIARIKPQKNSK